ncbi:glutaconate CoA-transferase subunit B [Bacillus thermophilus]|uniref:Glutaconate CoA-transferase subunit B n=1 Tax=Siminovitchia thermophila TaxID=1245522 RepID=A0ABS2R0G6_9BACI|nr:CoA-transferase [Siminovitchia thermophila]MBM7713138.1 glutaconate CoA-transferase subunit B [Siminovitchia thermophila]
MSNVQLADNITIAMARLIKDGERVFHGVASPMPAVAIQLAKKLHAQTAVYLSIPGGVDAVPAAFSSYSSADPVLREGSISDFPLSDIFDLSARGGLDVAFLSGAQIDGYGRMNLSAIGTYDQPKVRLPGGAGSAALLPTAKRGILWKTNHDKRSLVEKLDIVTAAGNTEFVITPLGIFKKSKEDGRLRLYAIFPNSSLQEIQENTGFVVEKHEEFIEFPPVTKEELSILQSIDPNGTRFSEFK